VVSGEEVERAAERRRRVVGGVDEEAAEVVERVLAQAVPLSDLLGPPGKDVHRALGEE
jgi:hypothetical protein